MTGYDPTKVGHMCKMGRVQGRTLWGMTPDGIGYFFEAESFLKRRGYTKYVMAGEHADGSYVGWLEPYGSI